MAWHYSRRSTRNLNECHLHLIHLAHKGLARSPYDLGISDGGRTIEEQRHFLEIGASHTMRSRHRYAWPLTPAGNKIRTYQDPVSHAFDFMVYINGKVQWQFGLYQQVWDEVWKPLAQELGYAVNWGGNWRSKDGPHIQLSWQDYPARYA